MRHFLTTLTTLALLALGSGAQAQSDPIGNLIDMINADPETSTTPAAEAPPVVLTDVPAPDWRMRATLYHSGAGGVGTRDATGCQVVPMRTVAVDRNLVPRRSILFIRETVGMLMPNGRLHDGYWFASDTGNAIRGARIDLFTGMNAASMRPAMRFSTAMVSVNKVGTFQGCPRADGPADGELAEGFRTPSAA